MKLKMLVFVALIATPLGFASEAPQKLPGQICIILIPSYNNAAWRRAIKEASYTHESCPDGLNSHKTSESPDGLQLQEQKMEDAIIIGSGAPGTISPIDVLKRMNQYKEDCQEKLS